MNLEAILSALIAKGAWAQAALLAFDALPDRPLRRVHISTRTRDALVNPDSDLIWAFRLSVLGGLMHNHTGGKCHCAPCSEQQETAQWLSSQGKGSAGEILTRLRAPATGANAPARKP